MICILHVFTQRDMEKTKQSREANAVGTLIAAINETVVYTYPVNLHRKSFLQAQQPGQGEVSSCDAQNNKTKNCFGDGSVL